MATTTNLTTLKINYLTQSQYDTAVANNQINSNELYLTPAGTIGTISGVTAGTGLSGGGTSGAVTLNHSNSITAKTTSAVYPIKIDAQGHISEAGNAVTIPTITLNGSATTSPSFYAPTSAGTSGYILKSNGSGAPGWVSATLTDTMVTVAENTKTTKYYPILATGAGTATRQIDTNDKNDSAATASGLWYQDGVLCAPSLQVGDLDYSLTTAEYNALNTALDAIQ